MFGEAFQCGRPTVVNDDDLRHVVEEDNSITT